MCNLFVVGLIPFVSRLILFVILGFLDSQNLLVRSIHSNVVSNESHAVMLILGRLQVFERGLLLPEHAERQDEHDLVLLLFG